MVIIMKSEDIKKCVTKIEIENIMNIADTCGICVSDLFHNVLIGFESKKVPAKDTLELINSILFVVNNLDKNDEQTKRLTEVVLKLQEFFIKLEKEETKVG
jgi:hypothetical protein